MKKHLVTVMAALALSLSASAIRAIHKLFPVKQSDGTTVMLYKNGNGYLAFYTTEDNRVVIRDDSGTLCYAQAVDGKLVASATAVHNIGERTEAEKSFLASCTLTPSEAARIDEADIAQAGEVARPKRIAASTTDGMGQYGVTAGGSLPSVGSPTIPVIMVQFSDVKFQDKWTVERFSRYMNEEGYKADDSRQVGSVKDYFKAQSRGMFDPTFDVVAKVTVSNGYAYYGKNVNGTRGRDANVIALVKEAIKAAMDQGVSFKKYEVNNKVPNVIVLFAGYGEATGGDENTIWPHELDLPVYYGTVNGTVFGSYFVGNELNYSSGDTVMGMGVMVHELSHALGFPDLYDTSDNPVSGDNAYGGWSVMEYGCYLNGSYAPIGYTAYERSYMGWLKLHEMQDEETVTLTDPNLTEGDLAAVFRNPENANEYFILENRQPGTWYPSDFGSGLLVQRICYNSSVWYNNTVNNVQSRKRAMVVTASGRKIQADGDPADLFGNGVNKEEAYPLFAGTEYTGMPIYKVMKNPDGSVTFTVKSTTLQPEATVADESATYEKVTDVSTLATNDAVILVNEADGVALAEDVQSTGRAAVPVKISGTVAYANDYVMPLTMIKAANGTGWAFRTQQNSCLSASSSGLRTSTKSDANCIATITIAGGKTSIVFTGNALRKNLGYDEMEYNFNTFSSAADNLTIYRKVDPTGINTVNAADRVKNTSAVYNLSGQQVGDGYKGIVIRNGKKFLNK